MGELGLSLAFSVWKFRFAICDIVAVLALVFMVRDWFNCAASLILESHRTTPDYLSPVELTEILAGL